MNQFINPLFIIETEYYKRNSKKFIEFIDLSKSIKSIGYLAKKSYLTSVDFTEIYSGKMNIIKYLFNWVHFILINIVFAILFGFVVNKDLYSLIDNEFLPKNTKSILVVCLIGLSLTISIRFDILINEWHQHLKGFKFMYYLQENWKIKHGLNRRNLLKLSFLTKIMDFGLKFSIIILYLTFPIILLYITIESHRLMLFILYPVLIYFLISLSITNTLVTMISVVVLFYYKLTFDQLNDQFDSIEKRSFHSVSPLDQMRLIRLIKRHDEKAGQLYLFNLTVRRTIGWLYVALALCQMLPLNLYFEEENIFYKIMYIIYLLCPFCGGFGISLLFSWQIESAHRPTKIIYKLLNRDLHKKKFGFHFKWKVIKQKFLFSKINNCLLNVFSDV